MDRTDIQGNILAGYNFRLTTYLFLAGSPDQLRHSLRSLLPRVTNSESWSSDCASALNVAITASGFEALAPTACPNLPVWFRQSAATRARRLGDVNASDPATWVDDLGSGRWRMLLTVCAKDESARQRLLDDIAAVTSNQASLRLDAAVLPDRVEHFGFADGAAQPDIEGVRRAESRSGRGGGVPRPGGGWRPLRLGEFVLGYPDEDEHVDERPTRELSRNGSYLVWRKLEQDVKKFDESVAAAAKALEMEPDLVRAKVLGRWQNGIPLSLSPRQMARPQGRIPNDFRFLPADPDGMVCPIGSHIRRANPRDSLRFGGKVDDAGRFTARHRIIRRGVPYQQADRSGLVFVCANADIERQFEVVQGRWLNDGNAFGLGEDCDYLFNSGPIVDSLPHRKTTILAPDGRPRFAETPLDLVITKGCEYLFAPGLNALRTLAQTHQVEVDVVPTHGENLALSQSEEPP